MTAGPRASARDVRSNGQRTAAGGPVDQGYRAAIDGRGACNREPATVSAELEQRLRVGPTELTWSPDARLATLRFVASGTGGADEAQQLTAELERHLTAAPGPFRFLVDCGEMVDVDAGWRAVWAEVFKEHAHEAVIAWFNANPKIQVIILMFRRGLGVEGEVFATEDEARAYLGEHSQGPR